MNDKEIIKALIPFAHHTYNCESLEPMWHKGPVPRLYAAKVLT